MPQGGLPQVLIYVHIRNPLTPASPPPRELVTVASYQYSTSNSDNSCPGHFFCYEVKTLSHAIDIGFRFEVAEVPLLPNALSAVLQPLPGKEP